MNCQPPPFIGFPRQEYWSGLPFPFLGNLPNPGIELLPIALQADSLLSEWSGKARLYREISSVQLLRCVWLFATPWNAALQASLSITNSWSLFKLMSIESVMPSNHLVLCHSLLLLPSIFPSIRVFSNDSVRHIRCPKYWSFSFSISPSNEYSRFISFGMDWLDLLAVQGTLKSLLQHHSSKASVHLSAFFMVQLSYIHTWLLGTP